LCGICRDKKRVNQSSIWCNISQGLIYSHTALYYQVSIPPVYFVPEKKYNLKFFAIFSKLC
jgi:hypothetical protein